LHSRALSVSFLSTVAGTTELYTLSLHDALPISGAVDGFGQGDSGQQRKPSEAALRQLRPQQHAQLQRAVAGGVPAAVQPAPAGGDRKSTRLNSSHVKISYAVFCLKKKTCEDRLT